MAVTTEDYAAISDHMGRYCWCVDGGLSEEWVALWTEDGVFTGIAPDPVVGREALKAVPRSSFDGSDGGKLRHLIGNLHCDYADGNDVVRARFYNFVSTWVSGGAFAVMAICEAVLVRDRAGWLIKRNDARLLR